MEEVSAAAGQRCDGLRLQPQSAGLGLLGMVGIVYHALAPEGWFSGWLDHLWSNPRPLRSSS